MAKISQKPPKNPKYEFWRYRIFFITWLAYAGFYMTRKAFSVAAIGLQKDPNIRMSLSDIGAINQIYLIAYAVGQFTLGISGDKLGTRRVILAGMCTSIIVGFAMGLSSVVLAFGIFFCIQGLCQSTGWAPLAKNISYFFSQRERGVAMGWWCTNYAIGGMVAAPFAGYMADYFTSWRYAFFSTAVALSGVWLLFVILQRNRPKDVGLPPIEEYHGEEETVLDAHERPAEEPEGSWKTIFAVLRNRMILLLGTVYFCLKPTRYAILFYAPLYVNEKLGTGMGESGLISVCFDAAGPLGVLFGGYMSDRVFSSRRMPISIICLFALALVLFGFEHLAGLQIKLVIAGLLFAVGFLLYVPDSLVSGTAAIDFGTKKGASTASGFINGCGSIGAIFGGGKVAAWVIDTWGWNTLFTTLGVLVCLAGVILLPRWNALPATASIDENGCGH
jgi:OPA family sugar phosphate sensor protein UhpC-like MFS transporter